MIIALLALGCTAWPAAAQYDRDGRYVPSPNGIPADPTARPIPMYSGTPGEAIGTPSLPRPPPAVIVPPLPPREPLRDDFRPSPRTKLAPPKVRAAKKKKPGIAARP